MINEFYKNFKIRDYMDEECLLNSVKEQYIDCSLGTNPFIKDSIIKNLMTNSKCEINKYPILEYEKLKDTIYELYKECGIEKNNIAFGSWHNGNNTKLL